MKKLLLLAFLLCPSLAWAQCSGVFPANTYCGNNTGSPAVPSAVPGTAGVTSPGSSVVGDIAVWNNTAGSLLKDTPPLQIYGTIGNGLFLSGPATGGPLNPTFRAITSADFASVTNPTTQTFLSGSGTYTTPANVRWIEGELQGAGGGGAGSASSGGGLAGGTGGATCWNTTGAACTTPVYSAGGGVGAVNDAATGGAGGTVTGTSTCYKAIPGGVGSAAAFATGNETGGGGGASPNGGNGGGGSAAAGAAAATNSGGGGGGAGSAVNQFPGGGGGAGAMCRFIITAPAGTYTYAVGVAGTAGAAGASGFVGGAGAAGGIWITEHYAP